MLRMFSEHMIRRTTSLDGIWNFRATDNHAPDEWKVQRQVLVPGAWETLPGLESYRGHGRYSRSFEIDHAGAVRLVMGGVSHTGTVFVDDTRAGSHYDAFTPWDVIVPVLDAGAHELVVEVDNTFGEHSALHKENDYYTYGGITRPVELQRVPKTFIDKIFATPVANGQDWSLRIRVLLRNVGQASAERTVRAFVAGSTIALGAISVDAGDTAELVGEYSVSGVMPWSARSPQLYKLAVELLDGETVVDDRIDRLGFREVAVRGREILVNGKPVRLRGYNRHEDHPEFGNALPEQSMMNDLQIMSDLGGNFVRTSHYPNDMRFLDLCDELGLYVWEESHARSVPIDTANFDEQIEGSTREMLNWHYNHPSIVIWGCLNECDSTSEHGQEVHERVINQIRSFDWHRPVTYASNRHENDRSFKHADIVSINLYTGWYGEPAGEIGARLDALLAWIHSDASDGAAGKPVIISEFGAGANYGNRQRNRSHWSEEYQCDVLDECLRIYLNHPDIAGAAIWQFFDCRITAGRWRDRPRSYNNKGTLDEYRRPKLAYDVVRSRMLEAAATWDGDEAKRPAGRRGNGSPGVEEVTDE